MSGHVRLRRRRETGQALVEYSLMFFLIASMITLLNRAMPTVLRSMERPLKESFPRAYKNGHPKACGFDDPTPCEGVPEKHPRHDVGGSFRLFARGRG